MALRVLLADESTTIKKVMQLALQDFGIEVKAVPIGLDVMQVARSFQPDIVFADVLLAKRNGYDVSADLKADPTLKKIPVVLMWSGFMELDEPKAQASRADRRLEKPFDAETLRSLVKDLVPSLGTNQISNYLTFPQMPEFVEDGKKAPQDEPLEEINLADFQLPEEEAKPTPIPSIPSAPAAPSRSNSPLGSNPLGSNPLASNPFASNPLNRPLEAKTPQGKKSIPAVEEFPNLEELEEPEEFQSIPLPKNQGLPPAQTKRSGSNDDWARQDLSKYKIDLPKEDLFTIDEADLTHTSIALTSGIEEISLDDIDKPEPRPMARPSAKSAPLSKTFSPAQDYSSPSISTAASSANIQTSLDPMRAEELLRQEARSVLESIAWKLLPEIVERVVREELQKLLKDAERL